MSLELDLLELAAVVDGRAGEGEIEARLAGRRHAVAHQLQVEARRHRRARLVDDFVLDVDDIVAALEGVGPDQLDAADRRRFVLHLERALAGRQGALARQQGHRGVVVRQARAAGRGHEARLGDVEPVGRLVEQHHGLGRRASRPCGRRARAAARTTRVCDMVGILQQLEPDQGAAGRAEGRLDDVGGDLGSRRRRRRGARAPRPGRRPAWRAATGPAVAVDGVGRPTLDAGTVAGAATRAGGGPKNEGWPLCLFQASQIRNSEAENTTQRMLRRMSVMRKRCRTRRRREKGGTPGGDASRARKRRGGCGRHRVEAARAPRMAAADAAERQGAAGEGAMTLQGVDGVDRAGRLEPAGIAEPGAQQQPIDAHRADQQAARQQAQARAKALGHDERWRLAARNRSSSSARATARKAGDAALTNRLRSKGARRRTIHRPRASASACRPPAA